MSYHSLRYRIGVQRSFERDLKERSDGHDREMKNNGGKQRPKKIREGLMDRPELLPLTSSIRVVEN